MKNHRDPADRSQAETRLYHAIMTLRSAAECHAFFSDLCTPAELEALVDRWNVVAYITEGLPYRRIHELTGVSVTTIGRVARCLTTGNGGYQQALDRLPQEPGRRSSS